MSLNWVLTEEPLDVETELALGFLDYLLLGTSASPLRKALNDSGLGEAIIGGGLMDELRQPVFSLGLKGVNPDDSQKVSPFNSRLWCCMHEMSPMISVHEGTQDCKWSVHSRYALLLVMLYPQIDN